MLMNPQLQTVFAALHTVEASEVTQRLGHESNAAFKYYKYSYPVGASNNNCEHLVVDLWTIGMFTHNNRMCV